MFEIVISESQEMGPLVMTEPQFKHYHARIEALHDYIRELVTEIGELKQQVAMASEVA